MSRRRKYKFSGTNTPPRAICDQCGLLTYHTDLVEQRDYRGGDAPVGIGILVCPECNDVPQPFYARPLVKSDPTPVRNPRTPGASGELNDIELREDLGSELREDGGFELRE